MVNYSISAMPVRLQKDKEGNINYNAASEVVKYYAKAQVAGKMTFEQFAEHVAGHDSKYHKGDILAIIVESVRCLKEELLNGKSVQLSDLGTFCLSINGPGAPSVTDFSPTSNITHIKVRWTPGDGFKNLRDDKDLQLVQVLTQKEDAAIKKQKRMDSPSVKKDNETGENNTTTGGNQTPSGGNQQTGGGTNTGGNTDQGNVDDNNPPVFG